MKPLLELLKYQLQQSNVPINMIFPSTICFIIIFIIFYIARHNKAKPNLPPSPPRLPLLGNFHQLSSLPFRSLKELSDKYGPLMLVHFGCKPVLIVSSAEVAREVMKTHDLAFASRPALSMVERLMYNCDLALAPYGEYWRQVRRISVLHLLSVKRVESFRAAREEEVSVLVDKIFRASSSYPAPGRVNLSEMIVGLTNDVISRAALGRKYSREEEAGVHDTLKEFTALMGSYSIGEFIPWFGLVVDTVRGLNARVRNNSRQVDCFLERVLDEHLLHANNDTGEFSNFVDVLLALSDDADDHAAGNISLTRDNIKAIILDMFLGGTDTTSTAIEWTMSELIRNPEAMRRLQQEVRSAVGCKGKVTEEDLEKMDYLKAVIKETLRLHPPIPLLVPRETIEQVELRGYEIPAGTQVMVNAWTIGRDPASWDRPGEFFPERFMSSTSASAGVDFRGKDFQLITFGSGRRGCPGLGFAIAMIQVTLARLLCHFDWELPDGMRGEELDMSEIQDVTVHRKLDLVLVARPRVP